MKVAFHLRRRPDPGPASAVLLESADAGAVLDLAARAGSGRLALIFRVAGGFIVRLGEGVAPPVGPIRLRSLADDLYLPVDADLVPALLDDEARGLTRDLGLVFLPGGRVLGFDWSSPVPIGSLVAPGRRRASSWSSFPDRPPRADRIREIALESTDGLPGDPFGGAGDPAGPGAGIGAEGAPRPEGAGAASTIAGRAAIGAGRGLIGLGALFGIRALAEVGARWIGRAVDRVPRLTEQVFGRQEGALRELLRQFREGDVDRALRHALPMGGAGARGTVPSTAGRLPRVDPTYSLRSLLGSGRGPGGIWFGGFDVQAELAAEYRKAADAAERRGDYRRAAYIHGRLLNDLATAALLLVRAGLHRDAGTIYLERLRDIPAAARAFEAAGDFDRALGLYRHAAMHVEAGDLLRRLGEEEEAVGEYVRAADLLDSGHELARLAAGDLLRDRARRPDLAMGRYARGWEDRPSVNSVAFALRMAAILADRGEAAPLLGLVDQAGAMFRRRDLAAIAGGFHNEIARLADRPALAGARDDLRDRALMGLGDVLRVLGPRGGRPGQLASAFFGRAMAWAPDVVGDATHALKAAFDLEAGRSRLAELIAGSPSPAEIRRIKVGRGPVSAVCHSPAQGEVFLGFESGEVYRVGLRTFEVSRLEEGPGPVASIAVEPDGRSLVMLIGEETGSRQFVHRTRPRGSSTWSRQARTIEGPGDFWLTPVLAVGAFHAVGVWDGGAMILLGGAGDLELIRRMPMPYLKTEPHAALLISPPSAGPRSGPTAITVSALIHDGPDVCLVDLGGRDMPRPRYLGWRPTLPEGHTLRSVPMAWLQVDSERLELAGLDREGAIHWSSLKINDAELIRTSNNISASDRSYAATTIIRAGLVAGVTESGVDWLRCGPQAFTPIGSTGAESPSPMACFADPRAGDLVVVSGDGTLSCIPTPR